MANWLSVESAAKKYGITEKEMNELVRLRYITSSSIHGEPDIKSGQFVDIDEISNNLNTNTIASLPDNETIERIPIKVLEDLKQENESLRDFSSELLQYIRSYRQRELMRRKSLEKLTAFVNELTSTPAIADEVEDALHKRSKHRWDTMLHFFK